MHNANDVSANLASYFVLLNYEFHS